MKTLRQVSGTLAVLATLTLRPLLAAEIKGTATDAGAGALVAASVRLENAATGHETSVTTDAEGRYRFPGLAAGLYRISVVVSGFSEEARTVRVSAVGDSIDVDFVLRVGNLVSTVTVTASRSARDALGVPLRAETIGLSQLQATNPTSTGDAMIQAPGITPVANGPFQVRPRLRGLDSTRVLILVDGERLNNARTATDRAGVEVGLADVSGVESVEVVSGSGSVLYGTDALAGTINIITAQPRLADTLRLTGGLHGYYSSNENGQRGAASLGISSRRAALLVTASGEKFDDYRSGRPFAEDTRPLFAAGTLKNADTIDTNFPPFNFKAFPDPFNRPYVRTSDEILNSASKGNGINASGVVELSDRQTVRVKYMKREVSDVGFPDFAQPFFFQNIVLPRSDLEKVSGRYQIRGIGSWLSSLSATVYYQQQDRVLRNINFAPAQFPVPSPAFFPIGVFQVVVNSDTGQSVKTPGLDVQATSLLSSNNILTTGLTLYRDRSEDDRTSASQVVQVGEVALGARGPQSNVFNTARPTGPVTVTHPARVPDSSFRNLAAFAQDEWDLTRQVRLVGALRVDSYGVRTDTTPGYDIASLTRGATPAIDPATLPNVAGDEVSRTALTGDVGVVIRPNAKVSFVARYGRSYRHPNLEELLFSGEATIGNIVPNIKVGPEHGDNFDLGVKLRSGRVAGSLSYFNNKYTDFISTQITARGCCGSAVTDARGTLSQAVNLGDVRITGVEGDIEIPFRVGGVLATFFGNGAYNHGQVLRGVDPVTARKLDDTPQDNITPLKIVSSLRVSDKRGRFWAEYLIRHQKKVERVAANVLDSPFLIAQDIFALNGFTLHRAGVGVDWKREGYDLGLSVNLENLANAYYREQFQFAPGRGRSLTFGLHLRKL